MLVVNISCSIEGNKPMQRKRNANVEVIRTNVIPE